MCWCMCFVAVTPVASSEAEETETLKSEVINEPEPEKFVEANAKPALGVETSAFFPKSPNKGEWLVLTRWCSIVQSMWSVLRLSHVREEVT